MEPSAMLPDRDHRNNALPVELSGAVTGRGSAQSTEFFSRRHVVDAFLLIGVILRSWKMQSAGLAPGVGEFKPAES